MQPISLYTQPQVFAFKFSDGIINLLQNCESIAYTVSDEDTTQRVNAAPDLNQPMRPQFIFISARPTFAESFERCYTNFLLSRVLLGNQDVHHARYDVRSRPRNDRQAESANTALKVVAFVLAASAAIYFCYKSGVSYGKIEQNEHSQGILNRHVEQFATYRNTEADHAKISNILKNTQILLTNEKVGHVRKLAAQITLAVSLTVFAGTMFVSAVPLTFTAAAVSATAAGYLIFRKGVQSKRTEILFNNVCSITVPSKQLRMSFWQAFEIPRPAAPAASAPPAYSAAAGGAYNDFYCDSDSGAHPAASFVPGGANFA